MARETQSWPTTTIRGNAACPHPNRTSAREGRLRSNPPWPPREASQLPRPQTRRWREIFRALTGDRAVPDYSDLRPARRAKNPTLTAAADHLGVWPARISELELGRRPNDELATRDRAWLAAA